MDIQPDILAQRFLFVFAHPDDESFYSGGLISKIIQSGGQAKIIALTNGNQGTIHGVTNRKYSIGETRINEFKKATAILGTKDILVGPFPDGQVDQIDKAELLDFILHQSLLFQPDIIVTFGDEPFYNHRDHIETEQIVTEATIIMNLHQKNKTILWKRGYAPNQLPSHYSLRNLHRKRTPTSRKKYHELATHQKGTFQVTLDPLLIKKRKLAILCHQTQKPEIFALHLGLPENTIEYYQQIQVNQDTF